MKERLWLPVAARTSKPFFCKGSPQHPDVLDDLLVHRKVHHQRTEPLEVEVEAGGLGPLTDVDGIGEQLDLAPFEPVPRMVGVLVVRTEDET